MSSYDVVGHPTPRADGPEKVTGSALYTADVHLPGTLWGAVLRSPFPHARIGEIRTSEAEGIPGVHAVLTGADVEGVLYGRNLQDMPVLAQERVRFVGEPVAAVAAVDRDTAEQALNLIDVEYEEIPSILDPLEALEADAPLLHPDVNNYRGLPEPLDRPSNVFVTSLWERGVPEEGFTRSDLVIEDTFTTPQVHQAYLEPHSCLVWIDRQDRVQVWASNKAPYALRQRLAESLGIAQERILVNHCYIGGDFGGKGSPLNVPLCYFLAVNSGRPVKMVMDYVEEFMAGAPRHASVIRLKTGVKHDGTLLGHETRIVFNSGAYGGFKPRANLPGFGRAPGPYRIPHARVEAVQVYTNTVPCGHMRAPGEAQAVFAFESHVDGIARRLGIDPLELRMKNLVQEGDESLRGTRHLDSRAKEALNAAVDAAGYRAPKAANLGRGLAVGERGSAGGESQAAVTLNPDGTVVLQTPIFEQGSGTYTTLKQIVAEGLGLTADRIQIKVWDTDAVSFDTGVGGSRVTRMVVPAAYDATENARQTVIRLAAESFGWNEEHVLFRGDYVGLGDTGECRRWDELLARAGHSVTGRGVHSDMERDPVPSFTAQVAEVSVDPDTGEVKLLRFTTAHDVGTILNPVGHQGQINGGILQAIGFGLMEKLEVEDGRVTSLSFGDYKIPTIKDIPVLQTVLLEPDTGTGPYGVKAIGENPVGPAAAAIANAVEDAIGVRIHDLPITAEKVYWALTARGAKS